MYVNKNMTLKGSFFLGSWKIRWAASEGATSGHSIQSTLVAQLINLHLFIKKKTSSYSDCGTTEHVMLPAMLFKVPMQSPKSPML